MLLFSVWALGTAPGTQPVGPYRGACGPMDVGTDTPSTFVRSEFSTVLLVSLA